MMRGLRTCWPCPLILVILFLSCCSDFSEARKLPSADVVGTVYCDTCFQDDFSKSSHYISGATVAVACERGTSRPAFYQEAKTDKEGTFKVHLPFSVSKHMKQIEGCTVKLIKSSEPYCAVASTASSSAINLKERKRGKHIFSAGFFTFKPLKQPGLCNQQPSITNSKVNTVQGLLPGPEIPGFPSLDPLPNPLTPTGPNLPLMPGLPNLPPLPTLPPLPPLPPLPGLPGIPSFNSIPQKPIEPSEEKREEKIQENGDVVSQPQLFFPPIIGAPGGGLPLPPNPLMPAPLVPNPLQPPSTPLIPNPFQPPAPPTLIPPVPQLPPLPSVPLPPVPVVPGLIPTPSPPSPASSFPQLPPLAPLIPGIPGIPIPPTSVSPKKVTP